MENKDKDKIFFIIMFILLFLVGSLIYYMSREGGQCLKNPYVYGASRMGNIYCSCSQDVGRERDAYFSFNDTTFDTTPKEIYGNALFIPLNYNNLNIT